MSMMSELDLSLRESGDFDRVEKMETRIAELDAAIPLEGDITERIELRRERRRLRRSVDTIMGYHARKIRR